VFDNRLPLQLGDDTRPLLTGVLFGRGRAGGAPPKDSAPQVLSAMKSRTHPRRTASRDVPCARREALSSLPSLSPAFLVAAFTHRRSNSFAATWWNFSTASALRALKAAAAACKMTSRSTTRSSVLLQTAMIRREKSGAAG